MAVDRNQEIGAVDVYKSMSFSKIRNVISKRSIILSVKQLAPMSLKLALIVKFYYLIEILEG